MGRVELFLGKEEVGETLEVFDLGLFLLSSLRELRVSSSIREVDKWREIWIWIWTWIER